MTRLGAALACTLLLTTPVFVSAAGDRPAATVRLEEQSACRLLSGGYVVTFMLRTSYATTSSPTTLGRLADERVTRATVVSDWGESLRFASPGGGGVLSHAVTSEGAMLGPGRAIEGRTTARLPLSTDDADWPGALVPGEYTIRFVLEAVLVDAAGVTRGIEATPAPLAIRIPDPSSAQECPFSLAPLDLLSTP